MELGLKGKVAVITGASKGIGKAIAWQLALEGSNVCLVSRNSELLSKTAEDIRQKTSAEVLAIPGDVSDPQLAEKVIQSVVNRWGSVDILVNNAGGPPPGSFLDQDAAAWDSVLQQNFLSVVRFSKIAAGLMKTRKWGRIINMTSTVAKEPAPSMVLSASARAAVCAFSKAISTELIPFGITVNTVCPGSVLTDRSISLLTLAAQRENKPYEELLRRSESSIPIQRFATPQEIAALVVFLASDQAAYMTGTSVMVDGGLTKSAF